MTNPSIETVSLTKSFGSFTALDKLDLKIEGGKCVGFLGPNGAGKTTTLKLLSDMIFPTSGECYINGTSVQRERKRALGETGVLIESPELYASQTPNAALDLVCGLRGIPKAERPARIAEVLSEVKMERWADQKFGKFSKGMKQRINIAVALVHDPDVIILDEPATGLDPRGMAEVREVVRGLKKRNRLVFMSSHILQEVTDVCDEVALIDKGKLLVYDTLANVTNRFSDGNLTVDVGFLEAPNPIVTQIIGAMEGVTSSTLIDPKRVRVRFKGGSPAQHRLLGEIVAQDLGAMSFSEPVGALEEVYLKEISKGD
jgi:ABC-2 type transport system ATP-binding protein